MDKQDNPFKQKIGITNIPSSIYCFCPHTYKNLISVATLEIQKGKNVSDIRITSEQYIQKEVKRLIKVNKLIRQCFLKEVKPLHHNCIKQKSKKSED